MRSNLITIVLLNYNHSKLIPRAIDAIKNQTLKPYKLIIGDDASTDNSIEIINRNIEGFDWITLKENKKNLGVIGNANELQKSVTTKYFLSAAADDFLLPDYLERAEYLLNKFENVGMICASTLTFDKFKGSSGFYSSSIVSLKPKYFCPESIKESFFRYGLFAKGATSIYKTDIMKSLKGFDKELGSYCDTYAAALISLKSGCIFDPCPGAVCERFKDGYASSEMRDLNIIKNLINSLYSRKKYLTDPIYTILVTPMFIRYSYLTHLKIFNMTWPKKERPLPFTIVSKFLSLHTALVLNGKLRFFIKYKCSLILKLNELISKFTLRFRIEKYNNYILKISREIC